jgi:hypothetical protein
MALQIQPAEGGAIREVSIDARDVFGRIDGVTDVSRSAARLIAMTGAHVTREARGRSGGKRESAQ